MGILDTRSLAKTVDNVNEMFFYRKKIGTTERKKVTDWIGQRQGGKLSYAKMFAPTEYDLKHGVRVFTGERITSGAAIRHVLGEETCRIMLQLGVKESRTKDAIMRAETGMLKRLNESKDWFYRTGMY